MDTYRGGVTGPEYCFGLGHLTPVVVKGEVRRFHPFSYAYRRRHLDVKTFIRRRGWFQFIGPLEMARWYFGTGMNWGLSVRAEAGKGSEAMSQIIPRWYRKANVGRLRSSGGGFSA